MRMAAPDRPFGLNHAFVLLVLTAIFVPGAALGGTLPRKAPTPTPRIPSAQQQHPPDSADTPVPAPRPESEHPRPEGQPTTDVDEKPTPRQQSEEPSQIDRKPTPRPEHDEKQPADTDDNEMKADTPPKLEIPSRPETSPAEEAACRQRLTALGAKFKLRAPLSDPSGCALPVPIALTGLGDGIEVQPEVLVNCATAEAVARFSIETVTKIAKQQFGSGLKSIQQASGYVCRPRNGTRKLSEHAFGNAFDIASFTLSDGTVIEVNAARNPKHSQFLSKIRTAACGPFKTVLGPGSDVDHATHFHLDLAKRRDNSTFCR
jgi:hypothetical protein